MNPLQTLFKKAPSIFITGALVSIQKIFSGSMQQNFEDHSTHTGIQKNPAHEFSFDKVNSQLSDSSHFMVGLAGQFQEALSEAYKNYPTFMLLVFLVNIAIFILAPITQRYLSKGSKHDEKPSLFKRNLKNLMVSFIRSALIYSFIYLMFHVCWLRVFSVLYEVLLKSQNDGSFYFGGSLTETRMLEEKIESTSTSNSISIPKSEVEERNYEELSLSIGRVVNSMSIDASALILSRDLNTAFVMTKYVGVLQILDVRNLQSPTVICSLQLFMHGKSEGFANLLLSHDGKYLFVADYYGFIVLDISNYEKPSTIIASSYNIENFSAISPQGMALTKNGKFFVVLVKKSLVIYDISNRRNIQIINFAVDGTKETLKDSSSLAIGQDDTLYLTDDGALKAYDVSDMNNIKRLGVFNSPGNSAKWVTLSKNDKKTAFIVSQAAEDGEAILEKVDISNANSIAKIDSFGLNFKVLAYPRILAISPDESQIFISADYDAQLLKPNKLLVVNVNEKRVWDNSQSLLPQADSIVFQSNKKILAVSKNHIQMIELYAPFPNNRIFSLSNNVRYSFQPDLETQLLSFSPDEKMLFVQTSNLTIQVWDISNPTRKPNLLKTLELGMPVISIKISRDSSRLYALGFEKMAIYDISNFLNSPISVIGEFSLKTNNRETMQFVMTEDEKIQYVLEKQINPPSAEIRTLNVSDPQFISQPALHMIALSIDSYLGKLLLSRDSKTLYFLSNLIHIDNVSNPLKSEALSSISISSQEREIGLRVLFAAVSHDDKTLFVQTQNYNRFCQLRIFNVSDLKNPTLLSESPLPYESSVYSGQSVLSKDSKKIYFVQHGSILLIDVSDVKAPKTLGLIQTLANTHVDSFLLKSDEKIAYLQVKNEIFVVDIQAKFTLFFKRENFLLGRRYMEDLMLLNFNHTKKEYEPMVKNSYKFIKSSLLDVKLNYNENTANSVVSGLPYWLSFDKESSLLTVEPQSENTIGTYTFCAGFSTKISANTFVEHGLFINKTDSVNLIMLLVSLGYVDNRYFLTPSLTSVEDFMLPDIYSEEMTEDIFEILKEYYFETCTRFDLKPSLNVSFVPRTKKILISTPNDYQIKLDIKLGLEDDEEVLGGQFLLQSYKNFQPKVLEKSSRLILEGSLRDIELALQKLVVNLEDNKKPCNGKITVTDYLNPPVTRNITNLSDYFKLNGAPKENETNPLQTQINAATFATGQSFSMLLDGTIFYDLNSEVLNYELFLDHDGKRAPIPNWLSFNHLFMKGVPPEEIFGRSFALILVAKNEFKEIGVPFTLHVQISPTFALKLAAKYFPYILTIIGLVIYANKIYNVFGKKKYKHPKEFFVKTGEEITNNVVFPVMFIYQEKQESEVIFKILERYVVKELLETDVCLYFIKKEQGSIDRPNLISKIDEAVGRMSLKEKERLKLYCSEDVIIQKVIQQLVLNKLVLLCLNLAAEEATKKVYETLKESWADIVDWDEREGLVINKDRFYHFIGKIASPQDSENFSIREELLRKSISEGLLKDAILAYAYENHHIDYFAAQAHINMKYRVEDSNFVFKFLKYDLKDINYSGKSKAGFGVKYEMKNDTLYFYGVPDRKLNMNALVIQITTAKQRILKEIWIHGDNPVGEMKMKNSLARKNIDKSYEVL